MCRTAGLTPRSRYSHLATQRAPSSLGGRLLAAEIELCRGERRELR